MKITILRSIYSIAIMVGACLTQSAQAQWTLTGNAGTTPGTNFIGTTDPKALYFKTNNSTRLAVTSAGKVGIGITSPVAKLHVKGSTNVSQLIIDGYSGQTNAQPLIRIRNSSGTDLIHIHSDDPTNLFIGLNAGKMNDTI